VGISANVVLFVNVVTIPKLLIKVVPLVVNPANALLEVAVVRILALASTNDVDNI